MVFAKNFAFDAKRVGVFFAFYALALLALGALALGFLAVVKSSLGGLARSALVEGFAQLLPQFVGTGLAFLLVFALLALVFFLAYLWLFAGMVRSAAGVLKRERKSFSVCLSEGLTRLPAFIVLSVLVGLLSWVASAIAQVILAVLFLIPVVGVVLYGIFLFLVSIVITLVFLFAQFFLLVKNSSIISSVRESVRLFARKPGGVLLAFLGYLVVLLAVIIVASLPLAATFLLAIASLATLASKIVLFAVLGVISVAILLFGLSFITVFNAGFFSSALFELSGEPVGRAVRIKGRRKAAGKKKH